MEADVDELGECLAEHARAAFALGEAQARNLSAADPVAMTVLVERYERSLGALDRALGRPPTVPMTAPVSRPVFTPMPSPRKVEEAS
jgi:hypothetical protein